MSGISYVAYELYKQNWIDENISQEQRLENIRRWGQTEIENEDEDLAYSYEEYREELGYSGGELYVCYDEFIEAEYQDRDFMRELLKSESLIQAYIEDEEELLMDETMEYE